MSMEKNGAISSNTPSCSPSCFSGGCQKQAGELKQGELFPESVKEADAMDIDLTKKAVDAVRQCSNPAL